MNLFEFVDRDLSVNLCRFKRSMTEHHLNVADVCAVLEHGRGHGVTEQMTTASLSNQEVPPAGTR